MKIIRNTALLLIAFLVIMASCKKSTDYGSTAVVKMSNGWWVTTWSSLQHKYLTASPTFFLTYNAAANTTDSLWLSDLRHAYKIKTLVVADYRNLTFSSNQSRNLYLPNTVTVFNGKVLPRAGHSTSGVVTDSLYLQALFSDDPGDTITIAGTARTGFIEDDF